MGRPQPVALSSTSLGELHAAPMLNIQRRIWDLHPDLRVQN
ncbi:MULTISPECIES: hypothetical protein [Streptomyces]|nr:MULTISPECIES: hypothetical protein [Streptomyces]MDX3186447.1 hypothetical protein [Streptomyces sp. ME02-7008A-1]MDX3307148.1 hypothetical protein [Streptomyces sp. ME02-7008A]WJY35481.1 hypothetical protein QTO28_32610 [Streptomyces sp. P9-2B-1]